ncbi:MAG TPA: 4Fe-4S binding protein [Nitrospirota bacterium]
MLREKIVNKTFGSAAPLISADRSRCVRMRFNKSTCRICTSSCRHGAISIDGGIAVDAGKCTACMLCVSECPSGCFTVTDEDFSILLCKIRKVQKSVPHAVLGCKHARETGAHEKTGCFGFLSEEHLIAFAGYLDKPLSLNLTSCGGCRNSFIVETLKERVHRIQSRTTLDIEGKIFLAENKADMVFEDVPMDRRGFFQAIRTMGLTRVTDLIEKSCGEVPVSYTAKRLPLRRTAFNNVISRLKNRTAAAGILRMYAFSVLAGTSCTVCSACIGMCPTGALRTRKDADASYLLFNSSLCTGCGLCGDFCPHAALTVTTGFWGKNYFDHDICNTNAYADVDAAAKM